MTNDKYELISGGHYTAYCLNHLNEQWYEYDDQYVTEVDIHQVENCEAYVLFYRKKNDLMYSQRQKAKDLLETTEVQFIIGCCGTYSL